MTRQHVAFRCGACGLAFELDADAPILDGSDPGPEYRRAFWCPQEKKALVLDVQTRGFAGRCPSCAAQLELLADFPLDACPRCAAPQAVDKTPRHGTAISREGGTGR